MDREFNTEDNKKIKDRLYFKLKSDRTIQIYNTSKRPLIEWKKKTILKEKVKKLFESGKEDLPDAIDEAKSYLSQQDEILNVDGKIFDIYSIYTICMYIIDVYYCLLYYQRTLKNLF